MKKTLSMLMALCMIFCLMTCTTVSAFAAEDEIVTGSGTFTATEAIERAIAWQECSNLAGKHEFYHSALEHRAELENCWVTEAPWTETMSWTNNTQFMYGEEAVYDFYCGIETEKANWLSGAVASDEMGIIENSKDWEGAGLLWYHMLMSPVIEVAGDGQTAVGLWQSWGTVTQNGSAQWTCEDYTMVFAKQSDGAWKIWHLRTFVHFYTTRENSWTEQNMATQGASGEQPAGVGVLVSKDEIVEDMSKPGTYKGQFYVGYDMYRVPILASIPEPYETWADIEDSFAWGGLQPWLGSNAGHETVIANIS